MPGTLRDSLVLLAVVLEQQTELQPTQIMTDTGAYSDVVFGLFRLLGYHFSPRLADVGGTRFWRTRPDADYGKLNGLARQSVKLDLIAHPANRGSHHSVSPGAGRVRADRENPAHADLH